MKKFGAGFSLGFIVCFFSALAWGGQPKMMLPETVYDFGSVFQGEKVEHVFQVRNAGNASLTIKKVKTSCGCTIAEKSFEKLGPGETGEIRVRFNSSRFKDRVRKKIYLYTDDPENPIGNLFIIGRIQEPLDYSPERLLIQSGRSDSPAKYEIHLTNSSGKTIALTGVKSSTDALKLSLAKNSVLPGETVILEVSMVPGKTLSPIMRIEVFTDLENLPRLVIPIREAVRRDIRSDQR